MEYFIFFSSLLFSFLFFFLFFLQKPGAAALPRRCSSVRWASGLNAGRRLTSKAALRPSVKVMGVRAGRWADAIGTGSAESGAGGVVRSIMSACSPTALSRSSR